MAEQNVPSQPPIRTDEQIVPRSQWLIIGKSNLLFNAQKIQKNPIFQISVDILKLLWEEFTPRDPTFFLTKQAQSQSEGPKEKVTPLIIPYGLVFQGKISQFVPKGRMKNPSKESGKRAKLATKLCFHQKATTTNPSQTIQPAPCFDKKPSKHKLPQKVRKGKPTFQLVDEDDEAQQESIPQKEGDDPDLELAKKMSLEAHQEKGEGEGDDADME
ncbi:hypothetical protein Tco_0729929 [Tanacetum coccineum]|uniref:Uncharacterized protein n=1 Tax=Tanacetum coccineum TaxID=301880 RepID=A0ABQ4YTW5_9ASTR